MGCVSSKMFRKEFDNELLYGDHIVSLTSTTLGALKLDQEDAFKETDISPSPPRISLRRKSPNKGMEDPEVINAWELMGDLEDEIGVSKPETPLKKMVHEVANRSRFFTQIPSPKKQKKLSGKENRVRVDATPSPSPKQVLRPFNSTGNLRKRAVPTLRLPVKSTPLGLLNTNTNTNTNNFKVDSGKVTSRRSLSPLFDPELVASFEKEICNNEVQIKKMVSESPKPRRNSKARESELLLELFEKKCVNGSENSVIIYTTTLRGIRRTFEDCNIVRSIIESHEIQVFERDISMDSGYREELRKVMGKKDISVPVVFVKGRLIGGAEVIMKLDEEGKLGVLFEGIPKATAPCEGCAGMRFVMCLDCSGSCKLLDEVEKKMVKCGQCNENGLIHCPNCC